MLKLKIHEAKPLKLKTTFSLPSVEVNAILQTKRAKPSTQEQTITPDEGIDALESVTIEPVTYEIDSNIIPSNIKENVNILGVTGNYKPKPNLQIKTVNPTEKGLSVNYDTNYDGLEKVNINPIKSNMILNLKPDNIKKGIEILDIKGTYGATSQIKYVIPSQEQQVIKPDEGIEFLSQVTIQGVTSAIDSDITPTNIKKGVNILGIVGTYEGKEIKYQNKTVSASKNANVTVKADEDYTLDTVTVEKVTSTIDSNIQAENIKRGVEILGVEGTYAPNPSMENKDITPTTNTQIVYPDEGYSYFDKVTVKGVTNTIDSNIKSDNIKKGVSILGITGNVETVNGESIEINPSIEEQVITPSSGKNAIIRATVNPVTNAIDSNIVSSNIKKGISILNVQGSYEGATNLQDKTALPSNVEQVITPDENYDALSSVTIEPITTEDITVEPSTNVQTINRSDGKFINSVTVNQVTSDIDANIQPENIKRNMTILGVVGILEAAGEQNYFGPIRNGTSSLPGVVKAILSLPNDIVVSGTTGAYMFSYVSNLQAIPMLDFSNITNATYMFTSCSSVTDWNGVKSLTSMTNADYTFQNCKLNTTFLPALTNNIFNNVTTMQYCFDNATLPNAEMTLNLSKITKMMRAFSTTKIDGSESKVIINLSENNTIDMNYLFYNSKIKKVEINVTDETKYPKLNLLYAFQNSSITELVLHENIRPTNLAYAFSSNSANNNNYVSCETINLDITECTSMVSAFEHNRKIKTINFSGNSSRLVTMSRAFHLESGYIGSLSTINGNINCEKVTNVANAFQNSTKIENLCALTDLGKGYNQKTANYSDYTLDLSSCKVLTHESLMNVINGLYDLNLNTDLSTDGVVTYKQKLVLGSTNLAKLTEEEQAIATSKGWVLS